MPSDPAGGLAWRRTNASAGSSIFLKLDSKRRAEFKDKMEHGDRMWAALQLKFLHKDAGRRFKAYEALFDVRKEVGEDMDTLTG